MEELIRICGEGNVVMVFMGNKIDLTALRKVPKEDGEAIAAKYGGKYFESSAKMGTGVHTAFQYVAEEVLRKFPNKTRQLPERGKGCSC